jgi:uncharacterized membrane protein (DUF2068 family)
VIPSGPKLRYGSGHEYHHPSYGLWHERGWGEWLGALSGALYVPFELRHLIHQPTVATALVIAADVVVVGFLAWQIWGRRRASVQ